MEIQRIKPTKWLAFFVRPAWCNPSDLGMTNRCRCKPGLLIPFFFLTGGNFLMTNRCRCEAGLIEGNGGIMKLLPPLREILPDEPAAKNLNFL